MIEARPDSSLGTFSVFFEDKLLIGGLSEQQAFTLVFNLEESIEDIIFFNLEEEDDEDLVNQ